MPRAASLGSTPRFRPVLRLPCRVPLLACPAVRTSHNRRVPLVACPAVQTSHNHRLPGRQPLRPTSLLLSLALATLLLLALTPGTYAQTWERALTLPPPEPGTTGPRLVALPLTADLLRQTPDQESISLFDSQGRGIPALVHERTGTTSRSIETITRIDSFDVAARGDGSLSLTVRLPEKAPSPTAFRFETPLRDFQRSVTISAMVGGIEKTIAEDQQIFDLSRYMDARRIDVRIEPSDAREFRIAIAAPDQEQTAKLREWTVTTAGSEVVGKTERFIPVDQPFRIDRVTAITTRSETIPDSRLEREVPCTTEPTKAEFSKQATAIRLITDNVPIERLVVETSSANFSRPVTVYLSEGQRKNTDQVATTRLSRFRYGNIDDSHLEIALRSAIRVRPEHQELWIEIENGDSPPLAIDRIRAYGPDLQLVFLADPGETYRVRYGEQRRPLHDTAALTRLLGSGQPPIPATLAGDATPVTTAPAPRRGFWNEPAFLVPTIALIATGFAFALYRAIQRIEATTTPDEPPAGT